MRSRRMMVIALVMVAAMLALFHRPVRRAAEWVEVKLTDHTVADRVEQYGPAARSRFMPYFEKAGVGYPPRALALVGIKSERKLEVWAGRSSHELKYIRVYPILGMSGKLGPKLREGDRQVPEGVYRIDLLNPNSAFHLSMRVDYPNDADRAAAAKEGRTNLGGDIFIHGRTASVGCLAMGDEAVEELFVLVAETGKENVMVILTPVDFRVNDAPTDLDSSGWRGEKYAEVRRELERVKPTGALDRKK